MKKKSIIFIFLIISLIAIFLFIKKGENNPSDNGNITYNFEKANEEEKKQFEISSNTVYKDSQTIVSGTIKNNTNSTNTVQVIAKMYKENGHLEIVSQTVVNNIEAKKTKDFEITFSGDYSKNKCVVEVEYINID